MGNGEWGMGSRGREETKRRRDEVAEWRSGGVRGKDTLPGGRATDREERGVGVGQRGLGKVARTGA